MVKLGSLNWGRSLNWGQVPYSMSRCPQSLPPCVFREDLKISAGRVDCCDVHQGKPGRLAYVNKETRRPALPLGGVETSRISSQPERRSNVESDWRPRDHIPD